VCATPGSAPPLVGTQFLQRFYSAGDLFARVRWSMPADKINSISNSDSVKIVAYLLQANGVPAGGEALKEGDAMKSMTIRASARHASAKVAEPLNGMGISQGYYTEDQADRGKAYFYGSCATCHTADPNGPNGP